MDQTLTYIGQPNGRCRFDNLEFRTTQRFNSLGVRDSEAALVRPRSIVIGDSHAMGWGVEAGERYSHLLSPQLQPSLNLAIASYGTARELRLLERYAGLYPQGYAVPPRSCCNTASMTGGKTAPRANNAFNPAVTAAMPLTRPM